MQKAITPDPSVEKVMELLPSYYKFVRQFFHWDDGFSRASNRLHASVGITEETVELIEELDVMGSIDMDKAIEEAGDLMFYIMLYKISTDTEFDVMLWYGTILSNTQIREEIEITHITAKLLGCDKKMFFKKSIDPILRVKSNEYLSQILIWLLSYGCSKFSMVDIMNNNMEKLTLRHIK